MKSPITLTLSLALLTVFAIEGSVAQTLKTPANSPTQVLKQNFALGEVVIDYSRPSLKGRTAFGEVVPFDTLWRTGANGCTKITFTENVSVEGHALAAGTYSLFSIPGQKEWTIIFNKNAKQSGTGSYKQEEDALRFNVPVFMSKESVETFTIEMTNMRQTSAQVELSWETTRVAFSVVADIDSVMMKNIDVALSPEDKRPYFAAASYYYDNGKDLGKALDWVNKALEQNPKGFFIAHLKAKILLKKGDLAGAKAAAELSLALAKDAKSDDYVQLNTKLLASIVKKG